MSIAINPERLIADLRALATIGKDRTGVHRPALSAEDVQARHWIADKCREAGLEVTIDRYGTVLGKTPGVKKAILIGSHTDTVPHGGWLDGALGVIYGLEIARAMREGGYDGEIGIDVVDFQDEEGTFYSCIGSKAFFGEFDAGIVEETRDATGRSLKASIDAAGFPDDAVAFDPDRHIAYLETHIEQGPRLENGGIPVGVAPSIVGIRRYAVTSAGQEDHAGTTPMTLRRDAGAALLFLGSEVYRRYRALAAPDSVWNIGSIAFRPGAPNVVPAEGDMIVECRAPDEQTLDQMEAELTAAAKWAAEEAAAEISIVRLSAIPPTAMTDAVADQMRHAARDLQIAHIDIPSGAGHDAMVAARHMPSGLLFVPSIGGRSHTIEEDTHEADIIAGCRVILQACRRIQSPS